MAGGRIVIVGGSVAGVSAATNLRLEGFDGEVTMVEAEERWPYDKPPLSKQVLLEPTPEDTISLLGAEEARGLGIDVRLGVRAVSLDPAGGTITTRAGESIEYDDLIIATGLRARSARWAVDGVHTIRTHDDAVAVREQLAGASRVVVVGAGFIGAEVASAAVKLGVEVELVNVTAVPMAGVVNETVSDWFATLHPGQGVKTYFSTAVASVRRESDGRMAVTLEDGVELHADVVVVGIGAVPNDDWIRDSGLPVDDGVLCDAFLRVNGQSNIYAIGDVSRWEDPNRGMVRIEHWTNAVQQGAFVAKRLASSRPANVPFATDGYVWSDQYQHTIQIVGQVGRQLEAVEVVSTNGDRRAILYADREGKLCGALTVDWPGVLIKIRRSLAKDGRDRDPISSWVAALQNRA